MVAPKLRLQRKCACGGPSTSEAECEDCKQRDGTLQRKAIHGSASTTDSVPPVVHEVLSSPGQPLDTATRQFLEPRFGHDFGKVRVHTDPKAAVSAHAVHASAYTVGSHIAFASGLYRPSAPSGLSLLAHELAHTIQQGSPTIDTSEGLLAIGHPGDSTEISAESVAAAVLAGGDGPSPHPQFNSATLQRQGTGPDVTDKKEAPKPIEAAPGRSDLPQEAAAEAGQSPAAPIPICRPKALSRKDFLAQHGATTNDFGLTSLALNAVTYPEANTTGVQHGVTISPTSAALPQIPSVFTAAGSFVEGEREVLGQGDRNCPSRKYPLRWVISSQGAQKIAEGEQEHCTDFQYAFDISLRRYADAVNTVAASKRVFHDDKAVNAYFKRTVGAEPADWQDVFACLVRKSLSRDPSAKGGPSSHTPRPSYMGPNFPDCKEARANIWDTSLPNLGRPSAEVIKDCGEKTANPAGGGKKK